MAVQLQAGMVLGKMDTLSHVVYGVTVFSRSGLAGGRKGAAKKPWFRDWSVWTAAFFGVLPDAASLGVPMFMHWIGAGSGNFFAQLDEATIVRYRHLHSLLFAFGIALLLRLIWKPLFVPAMAWPLHLLMDAATHSDGVFRTTLFYPVSDWGYDGIRWWEHGNLVLAYWLALPVIWIALWAWRKHARQGMKME